MFRNDITTVMMRRMHERPPEPLTPAMNLNTAPRLLMLINVCGILYFLFVTLLIVVTSFSVTLPSQYSGVAFWTRFVIAVLILFQVLGTLLRCLFASATVRSRTALCFLVVSSCLCIVNLIF